MRLSEMDDTQGLIDQIDTGVRFHYQIENRGSGIAEIVSLLKRSEDERSVFFVSGFGCDVFGQGLGGFVELESGEDVESDAFATEGEELMRFRPV